MQVQVKLTESQFGRLLGRLQDQAPWAAARAINRSLASGQTLGVRDVARDMKLKVSDVRRRVRTQEATKTRLIGRIYASVKRLPLYAFKPVRQTRTGVTAQTATRRYPGLFIARMPSGHTGVFGRDTKTRLPITERFHASIARVFVAKLGGITARVKEQLAKNIAHELKRAIRS